MLFKLKKLQSPLYSFCKAEDKISIYIFFIGAEKLPFYGDNSEGFLVPVSIFLRGGSRTSATSKMELFVIIVNGWKPLTIITKSSTLDVAAALDPLLDSISSQKIIFGFLDDALRHKMLLNHISLIFKNYSHKATESKKS